MSKNEYSHLINNYLHINDNIFHLGFHAITENDFFEALGHMQKPPLYPDMYAVLKNKVVILEHFEFDASHMHPQKGMVGKREEEHLIKRIKKARYDNKWHIDKPTYDMSFEDWQKNFETCFNAHYNKIDQYITYIKNVNPDSAEKIFQVGFFIENLYPPIVTFDEKPFELCYFETKQFKQIFDKSEKIDFILWGFYYHGEPRLFYTDRKGLDKYRQHTPPIDLYDKKLEFSNLNYSEIVLFSNTTFKLP
jgi:hypothetical protein